MKVKLMRLKGLTKRMARTDDVVIGDIQEGVKPRIGEKFILWLNDGAFLSTTPVTKIMELLKNSDKVTIFETKNSMYQLEVLE